MEGAMEHEVHVKQVPPQLVATKRCRTTLGELGKTMHSTLASIANAVEPKEAPRGAPFAIYHNEPFRLDDVDVEMGVPLGRDAILARAGAASAKQLPGGAVAFTIHEGPYAAIGAAYDAIFEWAEEHGHSLHGPPREIYLVGPGDGVSPAEYRTEIEVPLE
jgi:effector-binding domain-containing protein